MLIYKQAIRPRPSYFAKRSIHMKKKVLITGVTGTMGFATLKQFAAHPGEFDVRVLARKSDSN